MLKDITNAYYNFKKSKYNLLIKPSEYDIGLNFSEHTLLPENLDNTPISITLKNIGNSDINNISLKFEYLNFDLEATLENLKNVFPSIDIVDGKARLFTKLSYDESTYSSVIIDMKQIAEIKLDQLSFHPNHNIVDLPLPQSLILKICLDIFSKSSIAEKRHNRSIPVDDDDFMSQSYLEKRFQDRITDLNPIKISAEYSFEGNMVKKEFFLNSRYLITSYAFKFNDPKQKQVAVSLGFGLLAWQNKDNTEQGFYYKKAETYSPTAS